MSAFIEVRFSDDGGNNWSNWRVLNAGATGSFLKPLIRRLLGWTREERIWEFRDTSSVAAEVLSASIMSLGNSQWRPLPLPDGSYSDETRPWTSQDVCDYLPTFAEAQGTRSRCKYVPVPGLSAFSGVGNGPHRGLRDVEGKLFVISGNKLCQISTLGITTELGTIPGTRRVSMVHNQIDGGNELIIATGDNSYVWNTVTETLTATGVPLLFVDFVNQLIVGIDVGRRFWRYSGLADATAWNTLDNESAESSPDRLVGVIVSQGEVLLFGERTIEVWSNSPTDNTAFQRSTVIEKGCANGNTICRLDNTVYFVGNDSIPYRLQGYTPTPIASKAITAQVASGDPAKLFANTWEDKGYVVYYLTAQDGQTWGYDVTCQKWHRRESFGLTRWRVNTLCKWNGDWYAGDYSNGKLYRLTWGYVYEGCEIMPRTLRTGVMHNNGNRMFISALKLLVNTGAKPSIAPIGVTLSGGIPDGQVGDVVSYQYTVTTAYEGQTYSLSASGLPTGLSMSTSGLVTGTMTAAGTFTPVITGAADCDLRSTLVDSVTVGQFTISGDVIDGLVGDDQAGTYTNDGGIEPVTYAVTGGAFPDGLTLATNGSWVGTYTTEGTYSWTVTATDANGNTATLPDTAIVSLSGYWWLTAGGSSDGTRVTQLWTSPNLASWAGPYVRSPNVDATYGPVAANSAVLIVSATGSTERITDYVLSDGVTTSSVSMGLSSGMRFVRSFPSLIFVSDQSGPYHLSVDDGGSWTQYASPSGTVYDTVDLCKLDTGRWLTVSYDPGGPRQAWYSDQTIPTTWTNAGSVGSGECLVSSGTAAVLWNGGATSHNRTETGGSWSSLTTSFTPTAAPRGVYGAGAFVMNGSSGKIARSTDDGLTFVEVALPAGTNVTSIRYANGMFLVTNQDASGADHLHKSTDAGEHWAEVTLPYDRTSSTAGAARVDFVRHAIT